MKISQKPSSTSKKLIYFAIALAIVVVAGATYWYFSNQAAKNTDKQTSDESQTIDVEAAPSELSDEDARAKEQHVKDYQNPEGVTAPSASGKEAKVEFMPSQEGGNVILRTYLASISDGTCTLTITNGERKHTEKAGVLYQPSQSSCQGFSVPRSKLGTGTWKISLKATSLDNISASSSADFEVF